MHVDGAKRGPAPAHDIPIVLGAYKPRTLGMTGRKADGWVPSLSYLEPGDLARGNAIIDAAARSAGRDPLEITRYLIVPSALTADDLVLLAREDGISTFVISSDDHSTLENFSRTVAPAVRERIESERNSS